VTVSVARVSGGSDSESPGKHGIIIPPVPIKASRVLTSKLTKICLNMIEKQRRLFIEAEFIAKVNALHSMYKRIYTAISVYLHVSCISICTCIRMCHM
jgi:hypothetical protein